MAITTIVLNHTGQIPHASYFYHSARMGPINATTRHSSTAGRNASHPFWPLTGREAKNMPNVKEEFDPPVGVVMGLDVTHTFIVV